MTRAVRAWVLLVNDFDQHAPVAIHAPGPGPERVSETAACRTIADGEYLDEPADLASMVDHPARWRARTPATHYCTHSLAPVALEQARRGRGWAALPDAARLRRRGPPSDATPQDVYFGVELSITRIRAMRQADQPLPRVQVTAASATVVAADLSYRGH